MKFLLFLVFLGTVSCQDTVLIADAFHENSGTLNYLKHTSNFLDRLEPFPEKFTLQYVPVCNVKEEDGSEWNKCFGQHELNIACTQKYIKGNFIPTILCFYESEYSWGILKREDCVRRSLNCTDQAAATVAKNIEKCVNSKEGEKLVKEAKKALPKKTNRTTNGFINKKATLFNKPPKELLCELKSLKGFDACKPCNQ